MRLRLIADDLTGALDTAAEMTGLCGPVRVAWDGMPGEGSLAIDAGAREAGRDEAFARVAALAPALAGAGIAYVKIDSLLRGQAAAQLAACFALGAWARCVVAPAFPAQGRITRGGVQMARAGDGAWAPVAWEDLVTMLAAEGLPARVAAPGAEPGPGVTVFDAESDEALRRIVASVRGPVLWCGSGGLARALAGPRAAVPSRRLAAPLLGLFGSDQAATARQVAACGDAALCIGDGDAADAARVAARMAEGAAMVRVALPEGIARAAAAARIAAALAALTRRLPRPGTLVVAGGETLRAVCAGLGATHLEATGIVAPGVPRSALRGGRWDGLAVVSKSGAFGGETLWRDLLAENGLMSGSIHA